MHHAIQKLSLPLLAVCAAGAALAEDLLVLTDGRIVKGPALEQKEDHVAITFEAGVVEVPNSMVSALLLEDEEITFEPASEEDRKWFEKGYVKVDGRWERIRNLRRQYEKQARERVSAVEDALEHNEWMTRYQDESKHFRWDYTVPTFVAQRFKDNADAYFEAFKKDWKVKRDSRKPKLMINFFANRKEFHKVGGAPGGALAYFMFIGDYDLCAYYDRTDPDFTEQVLFHEIGHYLHKLIDEDFNYPHWPGESLCEYYGGAAINPETGKLEVGLIQNGRLSTIRQEMEADKKFPLKRMITTQSYEDYTWGWSFVHMMMETKEYEKGFRRFFIGLARDKGVKRTRGGFNLKTVSGEEVLRYFMDCMDLESEEDLNALEAEWYRYIEELEFDGEASQIWEAQMARRLGESRKARRLFEEALAENEEAVPAKAHYDYAGLLSGGKRKDQLKRAVEKAPLTATYRYAWGLALGKDTDEGQEQLALAKEMDPSMDVYALDLMAMEESEDD